MKIPNSSASPNSKGALRHRLSVALATILIATSSTWAQAAYSCTGLVQGIVIGSTGVVAASGMGGFGNVYICNVTVPFNGVQPAACQTIYATLFSAQKNAKTVTLWFKDALTCTTHPVWDWLTGWYWGPQTN